MRVNPFALTESEHRICALVASRSGGQIDHLLPVEFEVKLSDLVVNLILVTDKDR